jgi:hypothetical protein
MSLNPPNLNNEQPKITKITTFAKGHYRKGEKITRVEVTFPRERITKAQPASVTPLPPQVGAQENSAEDDDPPARNEWERGLGGEGYLFDYDYPAAYYPAYDSHKLTENKWLAIQITATITNIRRLGGPRYPEILDILTRENRHSVRLLERNTKETLLNMQKRVNTLYRQQRALAAQLGKSAEETDASTTEGVDRTPLPKPDFPLNWTEHKAKFYPDPTPEFIAILDQIETAQFLATLPRVWCLPAPAPTPLLGVVEGPDDHLIMGVPSRWPTPATYRANGARGIGYTTRPKANDPRPEQFQTINPYTDSMLPKSERPRRAEKSRPTIEKLSGKSVYMLGKDVCGSATHLKTWLQSQGYPTYLDDNTDSVLLKDIRADLLAISAQKASTAQISALQQVIDETLGFSGGKDIWHMVASNASKGRTNKLGLLTSTEIELALCQLKAQSGDEYTYATEAQHAASALGDHTRRRL